MPSGWVHITDIKVLWDNEDHHKFDHVHAAEYEREEKTSNANNKCNKKITATENVQAALKAFLELDLSVQNVQTTFYYLLRVEVDEKIDWTILAGEHKIIHWMQWTILMKMLVNSGKRLHGTKDKDLDNVDCRAIFFEHFFPNLNGKLEILDKFLSNNHANYHNIVVAGSIEFEQ